LITTKDDGCPPVIDKHGMGNGWESTRDLYAILDFHYGMDGQKPKKTCNLTLAYKTFPKKFKRLLKLALFWD
jgi:hypothetical protein